MFFSFPQNEYALLFNLQLSLIGKLYAVSIIHFTKLYDDFHVEIYRILLSFIFFSLFGNFT